MQSSDAWLKLHRSVATLLNKESNSSIEDMADQVHSLTYDQIEIPFNSLAKIKATEYINVYGLAQLRQRMRELNGHSIRHHSLDYIKNNTFHELTHALIWNIHNNLHTVGTESARELFGVKYRDPLTALYVNTAFEIACRLLGMSFSERTSYYDYKFRMPIGMTEDTYVTSMVDLIADANIRVNHESIVLAMLPFTNYKDKDYPEYGMTVERYMQELQRYNQYSTGGTTARTVFMKLYNTLLLRGYHPESIIHAFVDDDLNITASTIVYTRHMKYTCRSLKEAWRDGNLTEIIHKYYKPVAVRKAPSRWTMAGIMYRTLDWIWRLRMRWNSDYQVGIDLTLEYGRIFGSRQFHQEITFTYKINRYILEALGQTWIGYEATPIDRKCKMFRELARSYYDVTVASISMLEATGWNQLHNPDVLLRKLEAMEEMPNDLILPLVSTLAMSLNKSTNLSNFHVMSAMLFYAKHVLKDFALTSVEVSPNTTTTDILDWINYE